MNPARRRGRVAWLAIGAAAGLTLGACSSSPIRPAEQVLSATASCRLAWDQWRTERTTGPAARTLPSDMTDTLRDLEVAIPDLSGDPDRLERLRDAAMAAGDACADAERVIERGRDPEPAERDLTSASDQVRAAVTAIQEHAP